MEISAPDMFQWVPEKTVPSPELCQASASASDNQEIMISSSPKVMLPPPTLSISSEQHVENDELTPHRNKMIQDHRDGVLLPDCCRVPITLRHLKEEPYTPKVVSIGPHHHGNERLRDMERHKKILSQRFTQRAGLSRGDLVRFVQLDLVSKVCAYEGIYHRQALLHQPLWRQIWHWGVPERIKLFMWQVFHEKLPTNEIRARHNPSALNTCPFQCESEETILHVLRDCEQAQRVWFSLTNHLYATMFASGNLQDWLSWNSQHSPGNHRVARWAWQKVFSTTCWLLWKNRCCQVFEGKADTLKQLVHRCIFHLSESVEAGRFHHQIFQIPERGLLNWRPPEEGFIRIDVDGSTASDGMSACGGVIRDHQGNWVCGFQQKLGISFPTAAEIHAIHRGLHLCKQLGFKRIRLFTDSLQAVHLLSSHCEIDHPLHDVILDTKSLIYADWDMKIFHTHRENTRCADYLARSANYSNLSYAELRSPPVECISLFALERGLLPQEQSLGPCP